MFLTNEGLFYASNDIVTRFLYFSLPFAVLVLCRSKTTAARPRNNVLFFPRKQIYILQPILFKLPVLFLTHDIAIHDIFGPIFDLIFICFL